MRPPILVTTSILAATIGSVVCQPAVGDAPDRSARRRPQVGENRDGAPPAIPEGTEPVPDAGGGYARSDTIRVFRNPEGETVYAVAASHFDVSPPARHMIGRPPARAAEGRPPRNPRLPAWRWVLSSLPDPVVQHHVPMAGEPGEGRAATAMAPLGFNFQGIGITAGSPSDSNGSVGNDQFVETVNVRFQVWSLNRADHTVTSLLGPLPINALWSGFGGACESQNSGDPIVLYDKLADRWLIAQLTSSPASGTYYQCVALSTTADATGSFYRWAFAVPDQLFGDYPHYGVWTDAYYMMAHGYLSSSGGYVGGLFAALDRTKMLAGDPNATWQVIQDTLEGGHLPADLDGFAPPPAGAPGIFVSLHDAGMRIYRMAVDFATPANTLRTVQATVPVAASSGACSGGGACIPQPGTSLRVSALGDRLMFRAAYRKFVDHESLVVSHSVDPDVPGVASGVRWYDFRLSGHRDATCAAFPCVHQQGTLADTENGRSRWMSSIAMDGAENILVGYSTTGTADGTDNHSIRYTGRGRDDAPGLMTVPETIVVSGTANNVANNRWGDYASMSVDPFDDCTFWYVGQYYTSPGSWSTRVASARFPAGSGEGECVATTCTERPTEPPAIGPASVPGDNRITVSWAGIGGPHASYAIERADGACGSEGLYRPVGTVAGTSTSFTDTSVLGGLTYAYRVVAAADAEGRCQALVASGCVDATATGNCDLAPAFDGAGAAAGSEDPTCGVTVNWTPATSSCPLTPNMSYNVYRSTVPDFVPSAVDLVATCVPGPVSYLDTDDLQSGVTYHYVVRAEDGSSGNGGACGGGNEDANGIVVTATPHGLGLQATPGTWTDGGGDGTALLQLNAAGPGNTGHAVWRVVRTVDDPEANHTPGGAYAYRNAGPGPAADYARNECAEMVTPPLVAGSETVVLQYWERHQIEYHWDGVAVEYSVDAGPWLDVPPPSADPGSGCAETDDTTGWEPLSCTLEPPINGCDYPSTKMLYNGPLGSGTSCADYDTGATVTAWAHRCHPIGGLEVGNSVRIRWRFTSDPGAQYAGFYLDDVDVSGILLPAACTPAICGGQSDGATCDDGDACTSDDVCAAGTCQPGGPTAPPAEVSTISVEDGSLSWTVLPGSVVYDVASVALSQLRLDGNSSDAVCVGDDVAETHFVDSRPDPPAGEGYAYLVRGQGACGPGTYGFDSASVERLPANDCP